MGNTVAFDSPQVGGQRQTKERKRFLDCRPKLTQSKPFPFLKEPVTNKVTERGEAAVSWRADPSENTNDGSKLRYAVSEMQGWRSSMEDENLLNPKLYSTQREEQLLKDHHLFAVFDGHGGDFASQFCSQHFVSTLVAQKDWKTYLKLSTKGSNKRRRPTQESVSGLQLLKSALTATFLEVDTKLMEAQCQRRLTQLAHLKDLVRSVHGNAKHDVFREGTSDHKSVMNFCKELPESMPVNVPLEHSGSTGVVVLITPSHVVCANAGDSRAFLSKKAKDSLARDVLPLSFDHKPSNDSEVSRVEKDGGFVKAGRVDGSLAVSRGFGDFHYKNSARSDNDDSPGLPNTARSNGLPKDHRVTVHPDITVHNREPNNDEFVVLACDGIWDKLKNRQCANLVCDLFYDEGEADVGLICEEIIDTALELDSHDNMTVCTVFFPAAKSGTPNINSGVLRRRTDRGKSWGEDSSPAKRAQLRREKSRKTNSGESTTQKAELSKSKTRRHRQKQRSSSREASRSLSREKAESRMQAEYLVKRKRNSVRDSMRCIEAKDRPLLIM